jgi:Ca2+-transporting ATPase
MAIHQPIWTLTPAHIYTLLATSEQGLSPEEAARRFSQHGPNELPEPVQRPLWCRFVDQLIHFMAILLWIAGILAFISRTPELGWAIWAVIWINALFSFWQEYQAERALAALKNVLPAQVRVLRQGNLQQIPARALVPGDLMQLEEGDRISADARLVAAEGFYVDLSVLTGESLPVHRHADPVANLQHLRPAEVPNLVFAGSTVAAGRGLATVFATGTETEFGQVARLTALVKREPSTLEIQIARIVQLISTLAVGMGVLVFLLSTLLVGMEAKESFIFSIGIIVANVPEGLLPTVTLALALGVQRMAQRHALVRRLSAVEVLSATTVICSDKTGTLTKNEMTVRSLWIPPDQTIEITGVGYEPVGELHIPPSLEVPGQISLLLAGAALCSNARLIHQAYPDRWQEIGDPTEAALLVAALKAGLNLQDLRTHLPRRREIPFDSRRRMMTVVLHWQSVLQPDPAWPTVEQTSTEPVYLSFTKGSPLEVLKRCQFCLQRDQLQSLTDQDRVEVTQATDRLARQGFRVLGVALRQGSTELLRLESQALEQQLILLGLVAMQDPPRPEVAEAINRCRQAGIRVTMVTGDYGLTAEAIGRSIGLVSNHVRVVTGENLEQCSDAQLQQILKDPSDLIFARVLPEQKLQLVQAFKTLGHIVAVTGDGVNDAPALRAAHIGIAMGMSGTDVAREAADIILLDDNFATIVSAIEQGRSIYQNIRKFMTYILASNVPEIVPFLAMVAFKIPPALTILQILAVDLGTDMVPALALGAEPPEINIMHQPPRSQTTPLLDSKLLLRAYLFLGVIEAAVSMLGFLIVWWGHGYSLAEVQHLTPALLAHRADSEVRRVYQQATTLTLAAIVACQVGNVFVCRSDWVSLWRLGPFSNPFIGLGIGVELLALILIVQVPQLQVIFSTVPLDLRQWLLLAFSPLLMVLAEEGRKWIVRSRALT